MDAIDKITCQLQLDAERIADAYDYGLNCHPPGFCKLITLLWAKELVAENATCDRSRDVKRYTDTNSGKDGYTGPSVTESECVTNYEDITEEDSCVETTFTELL